MKRNPNGTGNIRQRSDGRYTIRVSRGVDALGNRIRECTTRTTYEEAKKELARMLSANPKVQVNNRFSERQMCLHVLSIVLKDTQARTRLEELLLKDPYVRHVAAVNQVADILQELREEINYAKENPKDNPRLKGRDSRNNRRSAGGND